MRGDFETADALRDQLKEIGVTLNDRTRKWVVIGTSGHPYSPLDGHLTAALSADARTVIEKLIEERFVAKNEKRFAEADRIQDRLRSKGVEVDDVELRWRFNAANVLE